MLAAFRYESVQGEVKAVTGDLLQDRMLVDTAIRLAEHLQLRDTLGPSVFLHALEFQHPNRQGTRYGIGHSQGETHVLVYIGGGEPNGRVVLQLPQIGDQTLVLEAGDGLLIRPGTGWVLPADSESAGRWLHLGYAKGTASLNGGAEGASTGIRLWGYPAGPKWRDLGLPARSPNNANTLSVTAVPLDMATEGAVLSGRSDTLLDLRLSLCHQGAGAQSPLHEALSIPLDGGQPHFAPCLRDDAAAVPHDGTHLCLNWAAAPRIEANDRPIVPSEMPPDTTYLTRLSVTARSLRAGDRANVPIEMGDQVLVLHSGSIVSNGTTLMAPAVLLVPTGSLASYAVTADAELTHILLERRYVDLGPQHPIVRSATVAFCIPIAPRDRTADWALASRLFNATLRAILAQSDPNWIIVAVGSEIPDLCVPLDDRFHFLASTRDTTDGSVSGAFEDGSIKRQRAEARARELGAEYLFFSDWDDIVHPDFVRFIRATRHPYGYVAGRGFLVDFEMQDIAPFPTWGGGGSLDELCTSTLVFNAHAINPVLGNTEFNHAGHVRQRYLMHAGGRPLMEIPFSSVAYMRFTALNLSNALVAPAAEGTVQYSQMRKNIAAHSVRSDESVRSNFGLDGLFDAPEEGSRQRTYSPKRLSVLVCTHNRPDGLGALLATLVPQLAEHPDREIIVVNDGTHDARYSSVIGQYASAVRYLPLSRNVGIAQARNRAAELALGEYMVFTDDDCEVPPFWLDWLDANLRCQPELDVVAGLTLPLRAEGAKFMGRVQTAFDLLPRPFILGDIDLSAVTACLAVRAKSFRRAGGFANGASFATASEDTELAIRLARGGARIKVDRDWHVFHVLATSIRSEVRRFRRYGYGNRQLATSTLRPPSHQYLLTMRPSRVHRYFLGHFRRNKAMADNFKGSWAEKLLARLVAALVSTAYDYGAATNKPQ